MPGASDSGIATESLLRWMRMGLANYVLFTRT